MWTKERKKNPSHLAKEACKQGVSPLSFRRVEFQSLIIWEGGVKGAGSTDTTEVSWRFGKT